MKRKLLNQSIEALELTQKVTKRLHKLGIHSVLDLVGKVDVDLRTLIGRKGDIEVTEVLNSKRLWNRKFMRVKLLEKDSSKQRATA